MFFPVNKSVLSISDSLGYELSFSLRDSNKVFLSDNKILMAELNPETVHISCSEEYFSGNFSSII